jgi:hypothetical protein
MISEAEAKEHADRLVRLTLMDGTVVEGYLFTPGYSGVRIQVRGVDRPYRFSQIRSVEDQ